MDEEPEKSRTAPRLQSRLQDPADAVRLGALAEIYLAGTEGLPDSKLLAKYLDDPNHEVRGLAVQVLALGGINAAEPLAQGLAERQPTPVRIASAMALGKLGPDAAPAMEGLRRCLGSPDDALRWHAAFALGKIGEPAVPILCEVLGSPDARSASAAANALELLGTEAKKALESLEQTALSSTEPMVRLACLAALVKMAEDPAEQLPAILQLLAEGDGETKEACLERLGLLGELAGKAVTSVIACFEDPSGRVRAAAALALARLKANPDDAIPALLPLLSDSDPIVRTNCAIALSSFGADSSSALPDLERLAREEESRVAATAKAAIARIAPEPGGPTGDSPSGSH